MINIGLFTPNQNPYSETFVQAHKNLLKDEVFYYYGSGLGTQLEGYPVLASGFKRLKLKILSFLLNKPPVYIKNRIIIDSLKKRRIHVVLAEFGIHAHNILPIIKEAKIPLVVHFHGFDASVTEAIEKCGNYSAIFEYASTVVVVSRKMEEMLIDLGCRAEKLLYNPCGPRPEFEEVTPTFSKNQFIGIGRFVDKKATYYTILAFEKVLKKHPRAQLILAGDGMLLNTSQNLVKFLKIEENVHFKGVITTEDFKKHLEVSVAFVQHSIRAANGDMEGTPVSIVEAGLAGLPVIATAHAGIADVIVHGETGLLCEEHDVDTMALHMISILDDNVLAREMGHKNRKRIKEHFSLEKHIQLLQQALLKAVEGHS
jgi:glycosyltransferase involved in cell wall biosynthesis